ncbi:PREDICTED: apoptosis regulatory protein Siva-like [Dufourea novaeangliae]|uniref:Apoptosis regulatory protein Siva n=1 Tax=Dufourea novaeangliae TaxID=178035 RepID=A0A154PA52_DUFNO|nr:PREDICTED: apoptosis regulatory protein Siva-like [Dufourea novaeangliae]KZC08732.1 Apoptosis regulatory protein Siva [Dufourea novaeangliae]
MPKRLCPFEDDLPPQLKVHVGQKQVDNGICREERMKSVYGKTMELLKEGVKSLSRKLNSSMDMNSIDVYSPKVPSPCKIKQERNSKQMVLNNKLELLGVDKAIKDIQPKYDLCGCTRVVDKSMLSKCSYCDQVLCNTCIFECISCSESFCQNCSLPVYDCEERNKCLNCYK